MRSYFHTWGPTALFVLLWGSAAIFSRWGLDHSSAFAILTFRFTAALLGLALLALFYRTGFPPKGQRWQVARTGALLIGGYSLCYFLALEHGITPGVLATVLGVQPMLTLLLMERRASGLRWLGLSLALAGLALVVLQGLLKAQLSLPGVAFALLALACMTGGAILQKRQALPPTQVLPLQYAVSLVMCLACVPFKPFHVEWVAGFIVPMLWLGLAISVGAQLLLYRMIGSGNLVNVTSLFYLVPVVTALLDWLVLGNALGGLALLGMAGVLGGLALVFKG
ncbi:MULTISPECIES: DMT family transporter [unclassified Pseudomonas]|uniref:DMT family transporter n=1 Tax=unclassified Pseudomonas TaxID=196821 RepID=UPI000BD338C2|nr:MULTISPECIES: DMT family transporter [unclassified Pseudomonas]PVZ20628.1 threonine/homoserine efflux transporter RhtA [Pseudomonas sp. URIL14HWK12:I12]PVZ27694.1 threonine/homoserine efflux transporter RhtA [Pseudomonas sp. URIL14HWK12:I10]PVZ38583.1 threonine/homoserine efflux transporter RhtA [Pseudomonas sp. URIL14HWK12:I11]SNZ02778.1 Threonine/homoserine efflux transporter RhtA [Pseudomonas sp. URIL14HWK12:I9]